MTDIAILIPVLGRAEQIPRVLDSIEKATQASYRPVLICSPGDTAVLKAARASDADVITTTWQPAKADFAKKINLAFGMTEEEWILQAATDLNFHPNWDTHALRYGERGFGVVGTNDLGNPLVKRGHHSTHTLFSREYIKEHGGTVDNSGVVFSEHYDHQFCTPPEAPIWMGDLSFKPIGEVLIGDSVVGWFRPTVFPSDPVVIERIAVAVGSNRDVATQFGVSPAHVQAIRAGTYIPVSNKKAWKAPLRRLCEAEVLDIRMRTAPIVKVTMASGRTFRCTPDHLWLNARCSPSTPYGHQWVTPQVGRTLMHVIDPMGEVPPQQQRLAGWLGGIYDGEGSGAPNPQIAQSKSANGPLYDRICAALDVFDIPYAVAEDRVWLKGGRRQLLRFLNIAQPTRDTSLRNYIIGASRFGMRDKIVAVEPAGESEVVSMTTSTGNYTAWGYASKNCDNEFIQTAMARGQFIFSPRSVIEHMHTHWGKAPMDSTYEKATRATEQDKALFLRRMRIVRSRVTRKQLLTQRRERTRGHRR